MSSPQLSRMLACAECFVDAAQPSLADFPQSYGSCHLCGELRTVWATDAWAEVLAPVLEMYAHDPDSNRALAGRLTNEWDIFKDRANSGIPDFVDAVCRAGGLLASGSSTVSLRDRDHDAARVWEWFSSSMRSKRRWFFDEGDRLADLVDALEGAARGRTTFRMAVGTEAFRARVCEQAGVAYSWTEMGAPPSAIARPGRANTAGIPVLYAASSAEVALYESRPARQSAVAVARLRATRDLALVDLTPGSDVRPNPFGLEPEVLARSLRDAALGAIVSIELARPVRHSDNQLEYIPTQFVAERLAALGYDGIRYQSSFASTGENFVIFDPAAMPVVHRAPKLFMVTDVTWEYAKAS